MDYLIVKLHLLNSRLRNTNRIIFVLLVTAALFFVGFILSRVFGLLRDRDISVLALPDNNDNLIILFFTSVIFAPIIETFLNQYLPYNLLSRIKYLRERNFLILMISALIFGILHMNSVFNMIFGFLMGIVFMYGYMVRIKSDNKTYYLIAVSHSLFNLGVFLITLFAP